MAQACRDAELLAFEYIAADQERSGRRVEPHRLVSLGRNWYLVAYDLSRSDWRTFRLDRLTDPRTTGARSIQRALPADDAMAFVRAGIAQAPRPFTVDAVVSAPTDEVKRRIGQWASVSDDGGETCHVQIRTESLDWAILALGATEADFIVRHPPELVEHLRNWAARFARATGEGSSGPTKKPSRISSHSLEADVLPDSRVINRFGIYREQPLRGGDGIQFDVSCRIGQRTRRSPGRVNRAMRTSFALTWDYRCPFARNAHEHVLTGLAAGADWDVTFLAFSLGQVHVEEGQPSVWDKPEQDRGILALQAGVVVRDDFRAVPERPSGAVRRRATTGAATRRPDRD